MNDHSQNFSADPRLTAYALGELEGAERAQIEELVRRNPATAAAVEEIRRLSSTLADALKDESVESQPAAEVIPIESGRRPWPPRIQPYLYVASGLAAGWAIALLLSRPAPNHRTVFSISDQASPLREEKKTSVAGIPAGSPPMERTQTAAQFVPYPRPGQPQLPPVPQVARQPVVDSGQLRQDLKNFELVQPDLGAGKRIALQDKAAPAETKDLGAVQLTPFEAQSAPPANTSASNQTLGGTRISQDSPSPLPLASAQTFGAGAPQTSAGGAVAAAGNSLARYETQLRSLHVIDGTLPGQGAVPGGFCRIYPVFLVFGGRSDFERMMADSNPLVAAMGALCEMAQYPAQRPEILARMGSDPRPVNYVRTGSAVQTSTLGALFHSIASNPNFLFPLGSAPPRP